MSGNTDESQQEGEETPRDIGESPDRTIKNTVVLEGNGSRPSHRGDGYLESDVSYTLNSTEHHGVCYGLDRASFNQGKNAQYDFAVEDILAPTMVAKGPGG